MMLGTKAACLAASAVVVYDDDAAYSSWRLIFHSLLILERITDEVLFLKSTAHCIRLLSMVCLSVHDKFGCCLRPNSPWPL